MKNLNYAVLKTCVFAVMLLVGWWWVWYASQPEGIGWKLMVVLGILSVAYLWALIGYYREQTSPLTKKGGVS
jgi:hypothetical protein